jgi:uncharacterized protein
MVMRIRVDEIPESGRFLHFHWDDARFRQFLPAADPFEFKLVRPLNVDLEIQKRTDHIRVQGTLRGTLQVTCHRCLEPFLWPLAEQVEVFLLEEEELEPSEEIELEARELDYEFFDGVIIEIDQLVAEQVFLALPVKILCADNCLGLCPRCGANLNQEPCKCEKSSGDSPFAGLKKIKAQLAGSTES